MKVDKPLARAELTSSAAVVPQCTSLDKCNTTLLTLERQSKYNQSGCVILLKA